MEAPTTKTKDLTQTVLRNANMVLPDRVLLGDILIGSGFIQNFSAPEQMKGDVIYDLGGRVVAPGLIDLHTHGGWGVDFNTASPEEILSVETRYAQNGVTRFLLTLHPGPLPEMLDSLKRAAQACEDSDGAIVGIHLEGPFLAKDYRGALPEDGILPYEESVFEELLIASRGHLRIMTFAPEAMNAAQINKIQSLGIVLSMGHTSASAEQTQEAIKAGVLRATHICNAMPLIHHRDCGPIVPMLLEDRVRVEVIADGHHIDDMMLQLILKNKGLDGVMAVSDSMPMTGQGIGNVHFAGQEVVCNGATARRPDGALAGSVSTLLQSLRRTRDSLGLDLSRIFHMGSTAPAQDLPHSHLGRITTGMPADLLVFNPDDSLLAAFKAAKRADCLETESWLPDSIERIK